MTLRRNVLLTITLIFIGLIGALFLLAHQIVTAGFLQQETRDTRLDTERAVNGIHDEVAALTTQTRDWAFWDDTYAFMADRNAAYVNSNLSYADQLAQVGIDLMVYVNLDGQIVAARSIDARNRRFQELPHGLEAQIVPGSPLLAPSRSTNGVSGLLVLPDSIMLISAQPILPGSLDGPARGTLIFGRRLDEQLLSQLAASTRLQLAVFRLDDTSLPEDVRAIVAQLPLEQPVVRPLDEQLVRGYLAYPDVYGHPALIVRVELPREVYAYGRRTLGYFVGSLVLVGVVSGVAIILLIERLVLARLAGLNHTLRRIGQRPEHGARVSLAGNDELAELAAVINGALTALEQARTLEQDRTAVLELIARREPLAVVFAAAMQLVERQRPGSCCVIVLLDGEHTVYSSAGIPPALHTALREQALELTIGTADRHGAWQRLAVVVPAALPGPGAAEYARELGLHPLWALPIRARSGAVLGMVMTYSRTITAAASLDMRLADTVCSLCTIAVEQRDLTEQLAYQGTHDALTGLLNRFVFVDRLSAAIERARQEGTLVAVLFIDIDRFKHINDTLGHQVGDMVLSQLGARLSRCLGESGFIARMGGDEFILATTALREPQQAGALAMRLLAALEQPQPVSGRELTLHASIGVSLFPADGESAAVLTSNADAAMYYAKRRGGNTHQFFTHSMAAEAAEHLQLEAELRVALERHELALFFQPQVDARRRPTGYEALLRWHHPQLGLVSPARFVPLAEETGLIHPIGDWVLREACATIARVSVLYERGVACMAGRGQRIAVNVSPAQFVRPGFIDRVREALATTGAPPAQLELELTESIVMDDFPAALDTIRQLKELGVRVAIDDFGTGYSSLSYLQRLPIDTLKIDRSFLEGVGTGDEQQTNNHTLLHAITALAHALGIEVVAEGVETEAQCALLQQIGCDRLQGFLFGRPAPLPQTKGSASLTLPEAPGGRAREGAALPEAPGGRAREGTALPQAPGGRAREGCALPENLPAATSVSEVAAVPQ
jgi:diguanylate cyclase (GGDEF)-like protein